MRSSAQRSFIFAIAFSAGFIPSAARASPWLPAPGHFYLELRELFDTTAQAFDAAGSRRPLSTFTDDGRLAHSRLYDAQTRVYTEIGLATRLAVVADFTVLRSIALPRAGERARRALGLGDLDAGVRLQLLDEEVTCALEVKLGIPTGHADGAEPLGTGDLRGEATLSIGHIGQRIPLFFVVELGARLRSSATQDAFAAGGVGTLPSAAEPKTSTKTTIDYASELVYALELGYSARVSERVRLTPRISVDGRHGLSTPTSLPIDPIAPASLRFVRVGAGLGVGITPRSRHDFRIDVQLGGGAFVWGEGLPAAGDVTLAVGLAR